MPWKTGRLVLAAVLGASLVVGCDWVGVRQSYPPDPLLITRKPVEAKADPKEPELIARTEPESPVPPSSALASAPIELQQEMKARLAKKSPQPGTSATPVSRSSSVPIKPAVRQRSGD